jgi:hypothetical protein
MEKKGTPRPTTEETNYGNEMKAMGYSLGYRACQNDTRRRRALKESAAYKRFGHYLDYLDDILWANRRK